MLFLAFLHDPLGMLWFLLGLVVAITVHEASHAWVAYKLGDSTAKLAGRITLNPLAHLDPMGTLFLFLVGFGWGIPVPINPYNFKNPKWDQLFVSLAGPGANLILAILLSALYRLLPTPLLLAIIAVNLILMIFNLLPIPPLDGSKVLRIFMSEEAFFNLQRMGLPILLLILLFNLFFPIIPIIINYTVSFLLFWLTGASFTF